MSNEQEYSHPLSGIAHEQAAENRKVEALKHWQGKMEEAVKGMENPVAAIALRHRGYYIQAKAMVTQLEQALN